MIIKPRKRLGEPPTVKLREVVPVVQSFSPESRIPGEFGAVRSVRLAPTLQPENVGDLVRGIQSRDTFLRDPGGEAFLPKLVPAERQPQIASAVKDATGYDIKFDATPSGERSVVSWAKPRPEYVAPPQNETAVGYPAVRMNWVDQKQGPELALTTNDFSEARRLPSDYSFGTAPDSSTAPSQTWGMFAKSDLKPDVVGYRPSELETSRQILGSVKAANTALGPGEIGDVMMRGGFPVSASSEMAADVYRPSATPKRWVDAPSTEMDSYQGTQALVRTGAPDAPYRQGYSVATNQSAPLQDVLTGVKGVSDLRLLPPASEPAYVTRHGQINPSFLSSTPSRMQAYGQSDVPGYTVLPSASFEIENQAAAPWNKLYPVKTREVTQDLLEGGATRPGVMATVKQYNVGEVEPAYVIPPKLAQATGGYDVTAIGSGRDYPEKAYDARIQVQMPSTVLKDKGTSAFDLSLPSVIDAKQSGLDWWNDSGEGKGYTSRTGLDEYVQAHQVAGVKNQFGEDAYIYTQPGVDAHGQLDKLEGSFRRANVPYNLEAGRAAARSRTPNQVAAGSAMDPSFSPARFEAGAGATVRRMLGNGEGGAISQRLIDEGYAKPGASTAELQDAYDRRMQMKTGLDTRSTARTHDVREQYRDRVFQGQDAIREAYAGDPNPEREKYLITLANRDGSEPATWEREGKLQDMLDATRKAQAAGRTQLETWLPTEKGQSAVGIGPENLESVYVRSSKTNPLIEPEVRTVNRLNSDGTYEQVTEPAGLPQIRTTRKDDQGREVTRMSDVYSLPQDQYERLTGEVQAGTRKIMPVGTLNPSLSKNREVVYRDPSRGTEEGLGMQQVGPIRAGGYELDFGDAAPSVAEQVGVVARPRYVSDPTEYNASAGRRLQGQRAIAKSPEPKTQGTMSSEELLARRDRMLRAKFGDNYQQYLA
jgi:hypothetical protein